MTENKQAKALFQDKTYDELDFLSKAIEPFVHPFQDILDSLPKEVLITGKEFEKIFSEYTNSYLYLGDKSLIRNALKSDALYKLQSNQQDFIVSFYKTETLPDTWVDFAEKTSNGGFVISRTDREINEKDVIDLAIESVDYELSRLRYSSTRGNPSAKTRIKEVIESLDVPTYASTSGRRKGLSADARIRKHVLSSIINTWKVRSFEGAEKIGKWISDYVADGDYSAYVNLTHFKVMTHSGHAIYDVNEIHEAKV